MIPTWTKFPKTLVSEFHFSEIYALEMQGEIKGMGVNS